MKIFLDANILVSVVKQEYPLFTFSSRILSLQDKFPFTLYTSPLTLALVYYFAQKKRSSISAKEKIKLLSSRISITSIDSSTVLRALKNKRISDLEDGMQYYSAINAGCTCIITEDADDYFFSDIEVLNAHAFLKKYVLG